MLATEPIQKSQAVVDFDQRVILRDVSWKEFELLLAIRGDRAGVRMTYLEGDLELMSPSMSHEGIKTAIGRPARSRCTSWVTDSTAGPSAAS